MPAPPVRLGIDFGTSNTVAVVRLPDGRGRSLLFEGSPLLPSSVYAEPNGTLIVGRDAVHSARLDPARFEPNPKRRVDDGVVLLGDRELPVVELVTAVLSRVSEEFRRTVGTGTVETTMTFPAAWGATRRFTLSDAAAAAGLGQIRLVPEPVAAATYFTMVLGRSVPIGAAVVVYDFGAGTFDATVVARTASGFEVLAVDGRDDLGGLDLDDKVIELVGRTCAVQQPDLWQRLAQPTTVEERRARRLLWDDARVAKERLSRQPSADLTVPLLGVDAHITRDELEELARPIIEQTIRVTNGVIRSANLARGQMAGVFLVGGSSRIPLVATLLHRALGEAPVAIEQPELVVAEGSMLAGAAAVPAVAPARPGPPMGQPMGPPGAPHPASPGAAPPVSGVPVSGAPVSAAPVSGPPVSGAPPVMGSPAGGTAPMGGSPAAAAMGAPVSAPPVSGTPGSGPPGSVSAPPASGPPGSVSAPPVSGPPAAGPVSPAGAPRSIGRVVVPGAKPPPGQVQSGPAPGVPVAPTRPMPRAEPAPPQPPHYRPAAYSVPPVQAYRPPPPQPVYEAPEPAYPRAPAGSNPVVRALVTLLLILLLILVPLVSGYLVYKQTVGEPAFPIGFAMAAAPFEPTNG